MKVGEKIEVEYRVISSDLAKSLSISEQDDFPEVLATSRMIALMELAAARLMKPVLGDGELSVGVNLNVSHLAATPNNQVVNAVAEFTGLTGKLYTFNVFLFDGGGKAGEGTHTRAVVKKSRLLDGANKRVKP
jgi:predicted thioesterase